MSAVIVTQHKPPLSLGGVSAAIALFSADRGSATRHFRAILVGVGVIEIYQIKSYPDP